MTNEQLTAELNLLRSKNERLAKCLAIVAADLGHAIDLMPQQKTLFLDMIHQVDDCLETDAEIRQRFENKVEGINGKG